MERRASLLLLLIILSGIPLSFAASSWADDTPAVELPTLDILFIFIVALLSVSIVALTYMIASSIQSPELLAWCKTQIAELILAAIIVIIVWAAVFGTNTMIAAIFMQSTGEESLADLGSSSVEVPLEDMEGLYGKVADAYLSVGVLQGTSYYTVIAPAWWAYIGEGTTPYFGASVLLAPLSNAANTLTIQILTLKALQQFLEYIDLVGAGFLLPLALAFRIFPFTKSLGNTMIALCLGAMFVLPLSLVVCAEIYNTGEDVDAFPYTEAALSTDFEVDQFGPTASILDIGKMVMGAVCKNSVLRGFAELGELVTGIVYAAAMAASCLTGYAGCFVEYFWAWLYEVWPMIMFFAELGFGSMITPGLNMDLVSSAGLLGLEKIPNTLLPAVSEMTGFSIFSFFLVVFITLGGIRSISAALGGEQVLYGLSRFI